MKYLTVIFPITIGLIILFIGFYVDRTTLKYFSSETQFYGLIAGVLISYLLILVYTRFVHLDINPNSILIWGILFRIILFFSPPNLSDDYYRFIWDGRINAAGENPFLVLPVNFIETEKAVELDLDNEIYNGFNSHHYYSVYPPINQLIYKVAAKFGNQNIKHEVTIMRVFILIGEIGSILLLMSILSKNNIPSIQSIWYAWNPMIILEFTGNLHFEGLMIFFILLALYLLDIGKNKLSAISWGAAIAVKLIPLMLLPLIFKKMGLKKSITFYGLSLLFFCLLFMPYWDFNLIPNIKSSLDLYFGTFEFNAGIIYLIRWIGYETVGYDITFKVMPIVAKVVTGFIIVYSLWYKPKNVIDISKGILICLFVYLLLGAIVHPWYIAMLVPFAILKNWKSIYCWVGISVVSYSAYLHPEYSENQTFILIEYVTLLALMSIEIYIKRNNGINALNWFEKKA